MNTIEMIDKELLTLAAKAAGIEGVWDNESKCFVPADGPIVWEPLSHDGAALRLAVKLGFSIKHYYYEGDYFIKVPVNDVAMTEPLATDTYAATRRAIVRAAAAIGEQMK